MNIREICETALLPMIGIFSLDPDENAQNQNRPGYNPTFDRNLCALSISQALDEIMAIGPASLSEQQLTAVVRAPVTVSFAVTQYSTTISGFSAYEDYMECCTVNVSGDEVFNELLSATSLLRPYMGGTGTVSATVYFDAIPLPSTVWKVLGPVSIPQNPHLAICTTREQFDAWNNPHRHSNPRTLNPGVSSYNTYNKSIAEPAACFVDSRIDLVSAFIPQYLRLNPMPNQAYPVTFRTKRKAQRVTADDIGTHEGTEPDIIIPADLVESIVVPLAQLRFMKHPSFDNPTLAAAIIEEARIARMLVRESRTAVTATQGHYT